MVDTASGTILVFRVKSYRVSISLRTGITSVFPESSHLGVLKRALSRKLPIRHMFHDHDPCLETHLLIGQIHQG